MAETIKNRNGETRDYKERFEFRFTVGGSIICQRYFRINNFNELSLYSLELIQTIRDCGKMIDNDLKHKTERYLYISAPQIFDTEKQMKDYYSVEANKKGIRPGHGIVIRDPKAPNYYWGKNNEPVALAEKFDKDGEFTNPITDDDVVTYKFAFYDNGREVCATTWEGIYPKYVRNSIDLSNKKGKLPEGEDPSKLGYEAYLLYKLVEGKGDIVWKIIKEICFTCSSQDNSWYTTSFTYQKPNGKKVVYDNALLKKDLEKEVKRMESYLNEQSN